MRRLIKLREDISRHTMTMMVQLKSRAGRKDRVEKAVHLKRFCPFAWYGILFARNWDKCVGQHCTPFVHCTACQPSVQAKKQGIGRKIAFAILYERSKQARANSTPSPQCEAIVAYVDGKHLTWSMTRDLSFTDHAIASTTSTVHIGRILPHNCLTGINYAPLAANKWHLHAQDVYKINASRIVMRMVCTFGDNSVHWLCVHTSSRGRLNCF